MLKDADADDDADANADAAADDDEDDQGLRLSASPPSPLALMSPSNASYAPSMPPNILKALRTEQDGFPKPIE